MAGYPTNHLGVRDLLFLNEGNGPNGRARFREVGAAGRHRPRAVRPLARRRLHRPERRRAARPLRRERRGPEPLLRQRAAAGRLGFRFVDRARSAGVADPNAGMGIAAGDFNGDGRPTSSSATRAGRGTPSSAAAARRSRTGSPAFATAFGTNFTGWGDSWVDLEQRRQARPRARERRDPGHEPGQGRRAGAGAREPRRRVRERDRARRARRQRARRTAAALAAADFDNDGHVDVAVNSVGGKLVLLRSTGGSGHWLEVKLPRFAPGAVVTARPPGRAQARRRRCTPARATSPPRIRASTSGSAARRR